MFVEDGTRIVSTSDDKSIRVWEWDVNVDFKYIADPTMHSMPCIAAHPNGAWLCGVCASICLKPTSVPKREMEGCSHLSPYPAGQQAPLMLVFGIVTLCEPRVSCYCCL